jgi:hypothetical protein
LTEDFFGTGYRSLFLLDICEPAENDLRVTVLRGEQAGKVQHPILKREVTAVLPAVDELAVEITWEDYVLYTVTNETYGLPEKDMDPPPSMLCRRDEPRFLAYIDARTWARLDNIGEVQHWALYCERHTIDVATRSAPLIRQVAIQPDWIDRVRTQVFIADSHD